MLSRFVDERDGGLFMDDGGEALLCRPKPFEDEAVPSGNGAAVRVLARLGYLLAETRYIRAAERVIGAGSGYWQRAPQGCCGLLRGWAEIVDPLPSIILRGPQEALSDWLALCEPALCHVLPIPDEASGLPEALVEKASSPDGVIAYLCKGNQCFLNVQKLEELRSYLEKSR